MYKLNKTTHYLMKQIAMVYFLWRSPSVESSILQPRVTRSLFGTILFRLGCTFFFSASLFESIAAAAAVFFGLQLPYRLKTSWRM
jgi:hypothetical protein